MKLNISHASSLAKKLTEGAVLDEIRILSLQVTLRFLMQKNESLSHIDIVFACDASISRGGDNIAYADFFDGRSAFLSDVYRCIGYEVTDVAINEGGVLVIDLGSLGVISIEPSLDDELESDWLWCFQFDKNFDIATLGCVYEGGRVAYFSHMDASGQA
jgi:hypothetical protein